MTENENKNLNDKKDILFVILFIFCVLAVALFNYVVDPYYIFRDGTIKGFNNVKTHKYSNKRTVIYSDIKFNSKNKNVAFTGNCLLSHYGSGLDNVAFFTIPVAKVVEVDTTKEKLEEAFDGINLEDINSMKAADSKALLAKLAELISK